MKPLLIGEANPYGADPRYALYPWPERASGDRLCTLVMGLTRHEYLRRFDRANLCPEKWSIREARFRASKLFHERPGGSFVLCGRKVAEAFGFSVETAPAFSVRETAGATYYIIPHPSGRCREWSAPGAFERGRDLLAALLGPAVES